MATNAELYGVIQPKGDVVGRVLVGLIKKAWLFLSNAAAQANLDYLSALTDSDIDWVMGDDETSKVYDLLANLEAA